MKLINKDFIELENIDFDKIQDTNAIYILTYKNEFKPIYIGIASKLKSRLKQHLTSGIISESSKYYDDISLYYWEFDESSRTEAQTLEKELINSYSPKFNIKTKNERKQKLDKTARYSNIVSMVSATMAIAIISSMLMNYIFDANIKIEDTTLIQTTKSQKNITALKLELEKLTTDLKSLTTLAKEDKENITIKTINNRLSNLEKRMNSLELALLMNPSKALALPIIRKDLDNTRDSFKSSLSQTKLEVDRIYDQNKWFIGLMLTIALSVLGMAITTFVTKKDT